MTEHNYGARETMDLLWEVLEHYSFDIMVPGKVSDVEFNPYIARRGSDVQFTPIGATLDHLGVDVVALVEMDEKHELLCMWEADPDEPCNQCNDEFGGSIYSQWLRDWLKEEYGIIFSESALDLLWEAEQSGLYLFDFMYEYERHNLTMGEYQAKAQETAIYPTETALEYLVAGLASEAGELAGVYAKSIRKDQPLDQRHMLSEVGDVLWFASEIVRALGGDLGVVANANLEKLAGRKERGTLQGSGESR